ncbi:MAG: 30S ribosomal protein S1 [Acidobacteria bacterium]|nr:30S ribosomal protein S1 [Acidobacteriota bacterium]
MSARPGEPRPGIPDSGAASPETGEPDFDQAAADLEYEHLLEDFGHLAPPAEGEVIEGRVLGRTDNELIVDVGLKSEGLVPLSEVQQADGSIPFRRGDTIEVMVDRHRPAVEGFVHLSHERAARLRAWSNLEDAFNQNLLISGRVTSRTKGGLNVDVGVLAFMPASHIDVRPVHNLDSLVGQDIPVRIVKINRRRGNVVVSRKAAVEEEILSRKSQVLESLSEGAIVTGVVKNLTDYGAFVDLGGIDGLLHVSDISYGRVGHPSEVVSVGDEVTAKVLKFDRNRERISLGIRQMTPDPWESVEQRYPSGAHVIGRVVSVTDYGAFVELEAGVEGLIHISEMTWSRRMKHPAKVVKVGDSVETVVLDVKRSDKRISLGIKQLEDDPWTTAADRYSIGSVVEGRVRKLTDFGAFIEIEEGIDGLVHVGDMSWTKKVKHPSEFVKKGQTIQAVVLQLDAPHRRLLLGIKQLQPDAWETFFRSHQIGGIVQGRVVRAAAFGFFVEVAAGVEALCHSTEIPNMPGKRKDEPLLITGNEYEFKIIKMSEAEKRIGLSIRSLTDDEEKSRLEDYQRHAAAATSTIEEAFYSKGKTGGR